MTETPAEQTKSQGRSFGVVALVLLILLMWPLSLGPVVWLYDHDYMSDQTAQMVGVLYQSLSWITQAYPPLENLLIRYLELWRS